MGHGDPQTATSAFGCGEQHHRGGSRLSPGRRRGHRDTHPAAAQIRTRITITSFRKAAEGAKARASVEMATEIGGRLPTLLGQLRPTGAGTSCRAGTAQNIVHATRVAYDASLARAGSARTPASRQSWDTPNDCYGR